MSKRDNHIKDQSIIHEKKKLTHDYKLLYPINPVVQIFKPIKKKITDFLSFSEPISDEKDTENIPFYINLIDQLAAENNIKIVYSVMVLKIMPVDPITFKKAISGRNLSDWLAAMELKILTLKKQRI